MILQRVTPVYGLSNENLASPEKTWCGTQISDDNDQLLTTSNRGIDGIRILRAVADPGSVTPSSSLTSSMVPSPAPTIILHSVSRGHRQRAVTPRIKSQTYQWS
jgi:hypothetical protein